jgi:uncharacterized Zn-finger protein
MIESHWVPCQARNDEWRKLEEMAQTKEIPFTEVSAKDLPLHCPTAQVATWSSHPRVFLDVAATGQVACPYCGTKYKLKAGEHVKNH